MEPRRKSLENLRLKFQSKIGKRTRLLATPTPAKDLYRLELEDPSSPIIPVMMSHSQVAGSVTSPRTQAPSSGSSSGIGISRPSAPTRVIPQSLRPGRTTTPPPPPPYSEEMQQPLLPASRSSPSSSDGSRPIMTRQRTLSASSWVKNVISRSSSRSSLRQNYVPIPLSPEEIEAEERIKAEKARNALAEWNRINRELKAAGF